MGPQSRDRAKTTPAIVCIKILLHIFNFLYLIIGICVLAIGIWTQVKLKNYMELTQLYYDNAAYIMIGVGILIMLVAAGGFYCTSKDKIALLYMYGIFISLIAILQIAAGIAGGAFSSKLTGKFKDGLMKSLHDYKTYAEAWDDVQQALTCCGVDGYKDWNDTEGGIPASCFPDNKNGTIPSPSTTPKSIITKPTAIPAGNVTSADDDTPPETSTGNLLPTTTGNQNETGSDSKNRKKRETGGGNMVFAKGCYKQIEDNIKHYLGVIIGVCVGFVILQVIGAILACCLARKTSKNNYEQIY